MDLFISKELSLELQYYVRISLKKFCVEVMGMSLFGLAYLCFIYYHARV